MSQPASPVRTGSLALLVALVLITTPIASAASVPASSERLYADHRAPADRPGYAQQPTPTSINNSTFRHRNPETVTSQNRLDDLQRVLGSRITDRLSESSVKISQAQYDQARSVLGEEYLAQIDRYGEVANARGDDNATSTAETFNETRNTQIEYSRTIGEFRETVDAYREAKANGNETRARRLAREVVRLGEDASGQAERLSESYDQIERISSSDLNESQERIQTVQADVDENRTEIASAEFVSTTLVVRTADERGSFTDPFELTGRLTAEDGPVSDRPIRLSVGSQTATATTNATGAFSLTYRPTVVPANVSNLTVRYVPRNTSIYAGSNTTVPVQVEVVTARVGVDAVTSETAFGEPVEARGSLTVDSEPVAGFPLAVSVDGARAGTAQTAANGSFRVEGRLPAAPRSGDRLLTVGAAVNGRAVEVNPAISAVQVRETETSLSATVTDDDVGENVTLLSGTLTAANRPVADQRIVVTVAGERVGTTRTDREGTYTVRVEDESGTVTVVFDGDGTSLTSAQTSVALLADAATGTGNATNGVFGSFAGIGDDVRRFADRLRSNPLVALTSPLGLVASGLTLGLFGFLAVATLRRLRGDTTPASGTPDESVDERASDTPESSAPRSASADQDPFASAAAALEEGTTDDAVIDAYAAVRRALASRVATDRPRTHWQFFDACVAAGVDADPLRTVTEAYETARYGTDDPSSATAERALSAARSLVQSDTDADASDSPTPSDD